MSEIFENLPFEKRQKIIDACIEEFSLNGYEKASTNSIVKKAEISKGTLFNYFGNKRDLFLYIFEYCVENLTSKFFKVKDAQPADIFDRLMWYSMLKMKIYFEKPLMSRLVVTAVTNMPRELKGVLSERIDELYAQYIPMFLDDIDTSKFRDGIDSKKAVELVSIFLDGFSNKLIKEYKDHPADEIISQMDNLIKECNEYLDMLKHGIYKEQPGRK